MLALAPKFLNYAVSFLFVAVYWIYPLQAVKALNGRTLWAIMYLLFGLSLVPFAADWMGEHQFVHRPVILYGLVLVLCAKALDLSPVPCFGWAPASKLSTQWRTKGRKISNKKIYLNDLSSNAIMSQTMQMLQYDQYGGPDVLHWAQVPMPTPANGQVLVAVKAASLNPTDAKIRQGWLKFPGPDAFPKRMGMDFAGVITQVGPDVAGLRVGDAVMGYTGAKGGSFAEFVLADAPDTFLMPANLSFDEATTLPMNAATALKVVNDYLKPAPGQSILINGAAGGLGLFVVQFCKRAGARVTGTATGKESLRVLIDLGTDEVLDYKTTDILQSSQAFDAILDTSGKLDFNQAKQLLNETGTFSTMVPTGDPHTSAGRTDGSKKELLVFAVPGPDEFRASQALAADGKLQAVVGARFPMQQAQEAQRQVESGQVKVPGKVVLVA